MTKGISIRPSVAAIDPSGPRKRLPMMMETLTMLGPGRNCDSDSTSVNSRSVSHRCCSTSIRRANGSTPPNPCRPTMRKPRKRPRLVGVSTGLCAITGGVFMPDMITGIAGAARLNPRSGLERLIEKRQAHVHPVVDVRMVVVELLVGMLDAGRREPLGKRSRAEMNVILVAPAAIDVDAAQGFEVGLVLLDKVDRILLAPSLPALFDHFSALEIERQTETERRVSVGVVGRRHAQVHDRVAFAKRKLFLFPDVVEKALDAAVVEPFGKTFAGAFAQGVVSSGLPL